MSAHTAGDDRVRAAGFDDVGAVAAVIADAFTRLTVSRWLVTDDGPRGEVRRARVLRRVFAIHVGHAVEHGHVHLVADQALPHRIAAAAVWFTAGAGTPPPVNYDDRLGYAAGPWVERFRTLDTAMHTAHPTDRHHHLAFLAVDPARQGIGLGSVLLDHHHGVLDHEGIPAYLEASSPYSRDLYQRRGYHPHGPTIALPGGPDPAMWPMWREPRPRTDPAAGAGMGAGLPPRTGGDQIARQDRRVRRDEGPW